MEAKLKWNEFYYNDNHRVSWVFSLRTDKINFTFEGNDSHLDKWPELEAAMRDNKYYKIILTDAFGFSTIVLNDTRGVGMISFEMGCGKGFAVDSVMTFDCSIFKSAIIDLVNKYTNWKEVYNI